MRKALTLVLGALLATLVLATAWGTAAPAGVLVKLNQVQVIGTHNSYHVEPPADLLAQLIAIDPAAKELAYSHPPLGEQFSYEGVRQIELDVYADPAGTLWAPLGTPGFKVFHIEGFDTGTTCAVFVQCLREVKAWSDARQQHMPIAILVEVKDNADLPGPPDPIVVGPAELDALDAEIRSVFGEDRLVTPDDVRGAHPTLEEAVLAGEWPAVDDVRGQAMFLLDNKRDEYRQGRPSLEGRVAFTPSSAGQPDAAFVKMNDPTGVNTALIQQLVADGYVVRTRADTPVLTVQAGDTSQRDLALASGAQWVSTDYPVPGYATRWGSDYVASIPGGNPARCNPVNAPPGCTAALIEDLPPEQRPTSTTSTVPAAAVTVTPAFTG